MESDGTISIGNFSASFTMTPALADPVGPVRIRISWLMFIFPNKYGRNLLKDKC
jgi:hypothetical protein